MPDVLHLSLNAWALTGKLSSKYLTGNVKLRYFTRRYRETALESAARRTSAKITQLLLDYKVYKAGYKSLALPNAIAYGNIDVAKLLLASGAHVGRLKQHEYGELCDHATALDKAAGGGSLGLLQSLLQHPTTEADRTQALQVAASCGKLDTSEILLES